jgi:hypothetical protein
MTWTAEDDARMRELESKATSGPWLTPKEAGDPYLVGIVDHEGCNEWPWTSEDDMIFAYACRTAVPAMLDEIETKENCRPCTHCGRMAAPRSVAGTCWTCAEDIDEDGQYLDEPTRLRLRDEIERLTEQNVDLSKLLRDRAIRSKCCDAPCVVAGQGATHWYQCSKCGKPI